MLHKIFMYSDKVMLAANLNNDANHGIPLPHPLPSYWMIELTNE